VRPVGREKARINKGEERERGRKRAGDRKKIDRKIEIRRETEEEIDKRDYKSRRLYRE